MSNPYGSLAQHMRRERLSSRRRRYCVNVPCREAAFEAGLSARGAENLHIPRGVGRKLAAQALGVVVAHHTPVSACDKSNVLGAFFAGSPLLPQTCISCRYAPAFGRASSSELLSQLW